MDLISKEDAVALIKVEMDKIRTHSLVDGTARINLRLAKNIIEDMPSIDLADYVPKDFHDKTCEAMAKAHQEEIANMVSVVRCKECKWAKANGTYQWCGRLDSTAQITADDFCSYGEPNLSEKPNSSTISKMEQVDKDINVRSKDEPQICDTCRYYNSDIPCGSTPSACKEADKFAEEFVDGLKKLKTEPQTDCSWR